MYLKYLEIKYMPRKNIKVPNLNNSLVSDLAGSLLGNGLVLLT